LSRVDLGGFATSHNLPCRTRGRFIVPIITHGEIMVPIDVGTGGDSSQKGPKSGPGGRIMGLVAARIWVKSHFAVPGR
jgi:hypothetical protein